MRVVIETELACTPEEAWRLVRSPGVMRHVSWPLTVFTPLAPPEWPRTWAPGRYWAGIRVLGVVPIGEQTIAISFPLQEPAEGRYRMRDDGSGQLVRGWDHLITLGPADPASRERSRRTRYVDRVDIDAGPLTALVWLWANLLYRWRQRRWRRLVARRPTTGAS